MQKISQEGISVSDLLDSIPDSMIVHLADEVGVDYYSKVLYGRSMFYMLLMGLLESERASLRLLEDIFNRKSFKIQFQIPLDKCVKYNSISDRLGTMNVTFFEKLFEEFYSELSSLYSEAEILEQKIVRVDSTMVAETSAKLSKGMTVGCKKDGKKQTKYTIGFDGLFPCSVSFFDEQKHLSEDICIPKVVFQTAEKTKGKIFTFDRGVQKRDTFDLLSQSKIEFVGRLKADSRKTVVRTIETGNGRRIGSIYLISDEEVRLFGSRNKKPTEETFRLITAETEKGERLLFLTNIFDLSAEVIVLFYRKRWDIEVFFRFLKQELNLSHFMSTNENGIKILLYMTLILSMLLLIYKRKNNIGYKTAKRRFTYELDWILTKMIVHLCGGKDPDLVFR